MNIPQEHIKQLLNLARNETHAAILVSNNYDDSYGKYDMLCGFGAAKDHLSPSTLNDSVELAFGHVSYQYKNKLYRQFETKPSELTWPAFHFFEPREWMKIYRNGQQEQSPNFPKSLDNNSDLGEIALPKVQWKTSVSEAEYVHLIDRIREKICNGEFYEMNFCSQFFTETDLDPYILFEKLNTTAPSPFAAFYKLGNQYLLCASPERFLVKRNNTLISQPIKGTKKRVLGQEVADRKLLLESEKDRAENVMIVDLVRNDMSRIAEIGSVAVPELCKIYTFSHVHQMISTVASRVREEIDFGDILEVLFPMGSMTGAPKIEVMKNIDNLESFSRQLYSGCVGYWERGDFDLNVVIRSLEYMSGKISFGVGGAITFDSNANMEYEECLTKAEALLALFKSTKG